MIEFHLRISENCTTLCESNGKETIIDMVQSALAKKQLKRNIEYMMLRSSKGFFVNLGKPTGALSQDDEYECIFKDKLKEKTVDSIREYCVKEFQEDWNIQSFYLKLSQNRKSQPSIGNITRIADVIQVDFFPEESLFEALGRDNRLKLSSENELLLRKWYVKLKDGTELPLRNKAESCKGKFLELYKNKNPDPDLPEYILPLERPTKTSSDGIKMEASTSGITLVPLSVSPVRHGKVGIGEVRDQSASYTKRTYKLCSDADLQDYIKTKLRFKVQKEEEDKAERKRNVIIKKLFKTYDSFVSKYKFQLEIDELYAVSDAVGAFVAEVVHETQPTHPITHTVIATCFRIGSEFIITNKHALQKMQDIQGLTNIHIDFSGKGSVRKFKVTSLKAVCSSTELDYVIFRLNHSDSSELPGSITSCGYVIPPSNQGTNPGNFFTLVGYHSNSNKAVNITCPIANPGNLDERIILSLTHRNFENVAFNTAINFTQSDDNVTWSHGLLGSPCLLRNEKLLMGLYCRGVHLQDSHDSVVEQVVLMSSIVEDVRQKISKGVLPATMTLKELFDTDQS